MIEMNVPGRGIFQIEYLVCDVNGSLAVDGDLLSEIKTALQKNTRSNKSIPDNRKYSRESKKINNE